MAATVIFLLVTTASSSFAFATWNASRQACAPKIFAATTSDDRSNGVLSVSTDGGKTFSILAGTPGPIYGIQVVGKNLYFGHNTGLVVYNDASQTWANHNFGQVYGLYGAGNNVHAVDYIGSRYFHSIDSGLTWDTVNLTFPQAYKVYATATRAFIGAASNGLYTSDDNGKTWQKNPKVSGAYAISGFDSTIFVGDVNGLHISLDNGDTWAYKAVSGIQNDYSISTANGQVYVGSFSGLGISSDWWNEWQVKTKADGLIDSYIYSVSAVESYVVVAGYGGLSISKDGGSTWVGKRSSDTIGLPYKDAFAAFVQCM